MNYAIETLQKEKELLEYCLNEWELSKYPEARQLRDKRLNDLKKALKKLLINKN